MNSTIDILLIFLAGTIVSGFSVFCFHYKKDNCLEMINTCLGNVVVGLCQLVTVLFLLIGWFWSIIWGCALVGHSSKFVTMLLPSVLDRADKNNREFGKYNGNVNKDVPMHQQ